MAGQPSKRPPWPENDPGHAEARELIARVRGDAPTPPPGASGRVWSRLESRRWSGPSRGTYLLVGVVGAAVAAVVAVGMGALRPRPSTVANAPAAARPLDTRGHAVFEAPGLLKLATTDGALVRLQGTTERPELSLERGSILLRVLPRHGQPPLRVRAPGFEVRVVGTVLRVVAKDGHGAVAVGHGAVEVEPTNGASVRLGAGQHWATPGGALPAAPTEAELALLSPTDREGVTAESFVTPTKCTGAPSTRLECLADRARTDSGAAAETALFEAAALALRELGTPRRALELLSDERRRFPDGPLDLEARASSIEALLALGERRQALDELDGYLARDPHGLKASEMHWLRAALYRELDGDCHRARAELDAALTRPLGAWVAEARRLRTACGDGDGER